MSKLDYVCHQMVTETTQIDSDRESDDASLASLQILADSNTGSEVEQYFNI